MELKEKNARDLVQKILHLKKSDYIFVEGHFEYADEVIALSFKGLQTLQYLQELEAFRFQMQGTFCHRRVLEYCPYESWGQMVFQEINSQLIPHGLVEIIDDNSHEAYSLTQKARTGLYRTVLLKKEKKEEENEQWVNYLYSNRY